MGWDPLNAVLFPAPRASYAAEDFPGELLWVPRGPLPGEGVCDEERIPCLFLQSPSARFALLYLHCNAEDLGRTYFFLSTLRDQFQVHVLAVEYPGYGLCPGTPSEESVVENANIAFNFLTEVLGFDHDEIIIFGRSIGSGPALELASKYRIYGLMLVCPFLSVRELCRQYLSGIADVLVQDRFPNAARMRLVTSPLLLVHGRADALVPWTHGEALFQACRTRKHFVAPERMTHNCKLFSDPSFFVLPAVHFFGLPDYSFQDLDIPVWAYHRRLPADDSSEESSEGPSPASRSQAQQLLEALSARRLLPGAFGPTPEGTRIAPLLGGPGDASAEGRAHEAKGDAKALDSASACSTESAKESSSALDLTSSEDRPARARGTGGEGADAHQDTSVVMTEENYAAVQRLLGDAFFRELQEGVPAEETAVGELASPLGERGACARSFETQDQDGEGHEDLPSPPEDAGFFKAPRSKAGPGPVTDPRDRDRPVAPASDGRVGWWALW